MAEKREELEKKRGPRASPFCGKELSIMKVIKIDAHPDLEVLIKDLYSSGESAPIFLEDKGKQVAVIVSAVEYETLRRVEEVLSDRLDVEESAEILKDPKWISWDSLQKQLKS
jgi:PHD/YefM family antitoxin component YafN of YafNO toxin-antitoxin module